MSKKERANIIEYIVCCVAAFAERYNISNAVSYSYLNTYKAIGFLLEHYDIEHTLSIDDAVVDMYNVCKHNGGSML